MRELVIGVYWGLMAGDVYPIEPRDNVGIVIFEPGNAQDLDSNLACKAWAINKKRR